MSPWFRLPLFVLGDDGQGVLRTPEDIAKHFRRGWRGLLETGYNDSRHFDFDIALLSPGTALSRSTCDRTAKDGRVLQRFRFAYIVAKGKDDDRWKVVAFLPGRQIF
mmetsp:Transcript_116864/g.261204  ORF Transcript_116864/g.261204 Transcript_116864/m.261204 type:complete len:107 (-) Transcript_116864:16-336(-)